MLEVYILQQAARPIALVLVTISLLVFVYTAPPEDKPMVLLVYLTLLYLLKTIKLLFRTIPQ